MIKKRICIIDCGSDKTKNIKLIAQSENHSIDTWHLFYPSINFKLDIPTDFLDSMTLIQAREDKIIKSSFDSNFINQFDCLIFSGGDIIEDIQHDIIEFFSYLKDIGIPTLGICFGHQIIGLVYGSSVFHLKEKISGLETVSLIKSNDLVQSKDKELKFMQNHLEAISLPNDFILQANSDTCENEMMKHKTKAIYGVQFHPEVSGDIGELMIKNFLNLQRK